MLALALGAALASISPARTQTLTFGLLHTFTAPPDGSNPVAGLYRDAQGNLFGTTDWGGTVGCDENAGCGSVFEIDKNGQYSVLYRFRSGADGSNPVSAVTEDAAGNFYGTTEGGDGGASTLFKLTQAGQKTTLFTFSTFADGAQPNSTPVLDAAGNIYGATPNGGDVNCGSNGSGCGVIYEMSASGKFSTLYTFRSNAESSPITGVVTDAKGSLYGATFFGGDRRCYFGSGCGSIFKLEKNGKFKVLHRFGKFKEGWFPGALTLHQAGNLYGTTSGGGYRNCVPSNPDNNGCGTIFKIDTAGKFSVLFTFTPAVIRTTPGYNALSLDTDGNIYGSAMYNGVNNTGFVFKLGTTGSFTDLFDFPAPGENGYVANNVIMDNQGDFYGTMAVGGEPDCGNLGEGCGTLFELTP